MTELSLATIAFNQPVVIEHQIRLLAKHLQEDYRLTVFDNSDDPAARKRIREVCADANVGLMSMTSSAHHEGLNTAARVLLAGDSPHVGFLDHDVFPVCPTRLVPLIEAAGFYGVGQRHPVTGLRYLWPGFCFFSREWLAGRELDFTGIRGAVKRDDGDTGSGLWPLFSGVNWQDMYRIEHRYDVIREPDQHGLQSWGVERIGDWIHWTNASRWKAVPEPEQRERLLLDMVEAL